jgi:hypothetical protein
MRRETLNWWWFFLLTGIVLQLWYYTSVRHELPPFAFGYDSYITGLNPMAGNIEGTILALVITLIFKSISRFIISIEVKKIVCLVTAALVIILLYFSLHNILYPKKYFANAARHYITISDNFNSEKMMIKKYNAIYFLIILTAFIYFFIMNFPKSHTQQKSVK